MTLLPVLLPQGYTLKVSVNDKVAAGQMIAEKKSVSENLVQVASYFNIGPSDISKILKKNLGDAVSEGEVLAEKKQGFGKAPKKLISHFSGTITKIDQTKGDVVIRGASGAAEKETLENIISPVDGTVDFCNNEKIVIKTDQDTIVSLDSLGDGAEGELLYIESLEEIKLTSEIGGKIILTDTIDRLSLFKAIGLDAAGIVIKALEDTDFIDLAEKKIVAPIMIVGEEDFKKLTKAKGKRVYLGGKDKTIVIL